MLLGLDLIKYWVDKGAGPDHVGLYRVEGSPILCIRSVTHIYLAYDCAELCVWIVGAHVNLIVSLI